ncbi:hypothetical protein F4804DRAFT_322820 [Jackrogersella minutella]|nr:hypothetical protein F4804DRAFT_322820 [Jackrogersella minutella]
MRQTYCDASSMLNCARTNVPWQHGYSQLTSRATRMRPQTMKSFITTANLWKFCLLGERNEIERRMLNILTLFHGPACDDGRDRTSVLAGR